MTTSYRTFLERSQHYLRRILRKPAWDFHRCVTDPRHEKGRRWRLQTLMRAFRVDYRAQGESARVVPRSRARAWGTAPAGTEQRLGALLR
jgi:hypothetical protein